VEKKLFHNSDFFTCHSSDITTHTCEFISRNSGKIVIIVGY